MKYHPDRKSGDKAKAAEEKFKEAKEAYEMLSDLQKRAPYDQHGHAGVDPNMGGGRGGPGAKAFGRFRRGLRRHLWRHLRGAAPVADAAAVQQVYRGSDLSYAMEITLEEARGNGDIQIRIPSWDTAKPAAAPAPSPAPAPRPAADLRRLGQVHMRQGFFSIQQTCPHCHGTGKIIPDPCMACSGQGKIKKQRRWR